MEGLPGETEAGHFLKLAGLIDEHADQLAELTRISLGSPVTLGQMEAQSVAEV